MRLRVLVIDDEECVRDIMRSILTAEGCEVFTFDDPASFPLYRKEGCTCDVALPCADILIADMYMPHVTGMEFIENLKKTGCPIPHMAVMSGNWSAADEDKAKTLGLSVFHKPFVMNDFLLWFNLCREKIPKGRILCDRLRNSDAAARKKPGQWQIASQKSV
jgi:CheY-like chemotaxis protein